MENIILLYNNEKIDSIDKNINEILEYNEIKLIKSNEITKTMEIIENKSIQCILLEVHNIDINNTDNDFINTIKQLKHNKYSKMVPIISVLTKKVEKEKLDTIIEYVIESGSYDYYIYNWSIKILLHKLKNAIDYKNRFNRTKIFEHYYLNILKNINNICFILSEDLQIKTFNGYAMKSFNLNPTYVGKHFNEIFIENSSIKEKIKTLLNNKKEYISTKEYKFKTYTKKNNEEKSIQWKICPINDDRKKLISYLVIGEINQKNLSEYEEKKKKK